MMILKVLSGTEDHGYGIVRRIRDRSGEVLNVEEGSLYPALHRLEKRGLLRSRWERSESNRRAKFYSLTPAGRRRFKSETERWNHIAMAMTTALETQGI